MKAAWGPEAWGPEENGAARGGSAASGHERDRGGGEAWAERQIGRAAAALKEREHTALHSLRSIQVPDQPNETRAA